VPKSYSFTTSKDLWGFQNNTESLFMRLNFNTYEDMKLCARKQKMVYEANIEPVLRLMHRTGIQSTGWLDSGTCTKGNLAITDIDLFQTDWKNLKPINDDSIAPFIIASFDIETNSSTGKFPDAEIPDDSVFQIAVTLKYQGSKSVHKKVCLCYKETESLGDYETYWYQSEKELLLAFREFLIKEDIDVITGWNIFGFDLEYLYKRAIICQVPHIFFEMSKLRDTPCEMKYKSLSSSALGDNTLKM
jgi:DNA polymerase delta subunit 1